MHDDLTQTVNFLFAEDNMCYTKQRVFLLKNAAQRADMQLK